MHRFKRMTAAVVSAAMMMSIVPAVVFADDADDGATEVAVPQAVVEEVEEVEEAEEAAPEVGREESNGKVDYAADGPEKLYDDYAYVMFYGTKGTSYGGTVAGSNLSGGFRDLYDQLRSKAKLIADGQTASSKVICEVTFADDELSEYENFSQIFDDVFSAVFLDCAYEFYWFGLDHSVAVSYWESSDTEWTVRYNVSFGVNAAFEGSEQYTLDLEKTPRVSQAVANAKQIVNDAKGLSDYRKIVYYKDRVCEAIDYADDAAADDTFDMDNNPWNLVSVFDKDDSTNVVCEGYAEAFQYLCDQSEFDNAYAYSVTGLLDGFNHKWNIVHIDDKNYMADVTNSDGGSAGEEGQLFLKGVDEGGSYDSGYVMTLGYPYSSFVYVYDNDTLTSYTATQLTLSTDDYVYDPGETDITLDDIAYPVGVDLVLADDIAMNLYLYTDDTRLRDDDTAVISVDGKTLVEQNIKAAAKVRKTDYLGNEYDVRIFTVELSARQMTDDVTLQVRRGDETGADKHYSVVAYARAILEGGYDTKTKDLCRAMLNYGSYAQKFFKYKEYQLANADLNYGSDPVAEGTVGEIHDSSYRFEDNHSGLALAGSSLSLKSKINLRLYFSGEGVIYKDSLRRDGSSDGIDVQTLSNGYQVVVISGITVDQLDKEITITFATDKDTALAIVRPMTYCYKVSGGEYGPELADLVKSLYVYSEAAVKYKKTE